VKRRPIAMFAAVALIALAGAGCGSESATSPVAAPGAADLANGQKLFTTTCGGCHTLAAAGTKGTIGPNLDDAYRGPASQDWERSSFEAIVREQIEMGSPDAAVPMPAGLLDGQDAVDVAAYVAAVAANPKAVAGGTSSSP
jgi:mono/diheme cytochrome c family protein